MVAAGARLSRPRLVASFAHWRGDWEASVQAWGEHFELRLEKDEPPKPPPSPFYNRVVQIDGEDDYEYWYVLTYLPDLQWCHVAPLERRGLLGPNPSASGHVAEGRPRWMLVPETQAR